MEKALAIRGEGDPDSQLGDSSIWSRRTTELNENASIIGELISWSEDVSEPPLTFILNTSELKEFINTPVEVPSWPCNTQSIDRAVKMASTEYFSQEKTGGGIRVQETSKTLMSKAESKQDLFNLAKFRKWYLISIIVSTGMHITLLINMYI